MSAYVKVRFDLQGDPVGGETIWAEPMSDGLYRLANIPFYAFGYAEGDIVRCRTETSRLEVIDTVRPGGNGTLRLLFADSQHPNAQIVLQELASMGCSYECASEQLVAVTVPPNLDVPFSQLASYLNGLSNEILIGWEIGKRPADGSPREH